MAGLAQGMGSAQGQLEDGGGAGWPCPRGKVPGVSLQEPRLSREAALDLEPGCLEPHAR